MQSRDLGMEEIAAVERSGDCYETGNFCIEFNGQAIALAEIAIEIGHPARLPLFRAIRIVQAFQQSYFAHERAILAAGDSAPGHV
jgi:hypothetical protein